jgi:hypothetical protein
MSFPWLITIEGVKIVPADALLNAATKFESIFTLLMALVPTCILSNGIVCVCDSWVGGFPFVKLSAILWTDDGSGILFFILLLNIIFKVFCEYY